MDGKRSIIGTDCGTVLKTLAVAAILASGLALAVLPGSSPASADGPPVAHTDLAAAREQYDGGGAASASASPSAGPNPSGASASSPASAPPDASSSAPASASTGTPAGEAPTGSPHGTNRFSGPRNPLDDAFPQRDDTAPSASASASASAAGSASASAPADTDPTVHQATEAFGAAFVAQSLGRACGPAAIVCGKLGGPFDAKLLYEESQRYSAPGGPADQQRAAAERRAARDDTPASASASAASTASRYAPRNQGSPHSCNHFSRSSANRC